MVSRRRLLSVAAPALVRGPAAAFYSAQPDDPALRLAHAWPALKAEMDSLHPLTDAGVDRLCNVADAAAEELFMTPAISPAGALACLQMIEVSAAGGERLCADVLSHTDCRAYGRGMGAARSEHAAKLLTFPSHHILLDFPKEISIG